MKCSFCTEFVVKSDISKHILSHTLEWGDVVDRKSEDEMIISEEKNKTSEYESDENLHEEESYQESQNLKLSETNAEDLFKCPLCEKLIPKLSKLEHAKKHVKTRTKNNCKHCGKTFLLKWVLEEHERIHTGEKPIQCSSCEKSFRAKQGLYIHVKTHHSKTLTTKCDTCGKTFHSKRDLLKHLSKYHGKDEGFKCDKCDDRFVTSKGLETHLKNTCLKHVCTICGKMFKQKCTFDAHSLTHIENDEAKRFTCDECGKSFKTQGTLDEDKRSHLNKKEFKCNECDKAFNRKSGLWCHKKIHKK